MFGYYRFLLASMVLFSHLGIRPLGLDPGVTAVVSFFILAGYVVCRLLHGTFAGPGFRVAPYYRDRLLRILPLYWLALALHAAFLVATEYQAPRLDWASALAHLTLVPLNFFWEFDLNVLRQPAALVIPPAWSIALELQAYALLPWITSALSRRWVMGAASLLVYLIAAAGVIDTDRFVYFYLPGVFFMFLLGDCLARRNDPEISSDGFAAWFPKVACTAMIASLAWVTIDPDVPRTLVTETALGALIGWTMASGLARSDRVLPGNRWLGNLSYSVFLVHWLVIRALDHWALVPADLPLRYQALVVLALSTAVSIPMVALVDDRLFAWRVRLGMR